MLGHYKSLNELSKFSIVFAAIWVFVPTAFAQDVLIKLYSGAKALQPSAVYDCRSITTELKCVSADADDAAHLSERPDARSFTVSGPILIRTNSSLNKGELKFYVASERALLDGARYTKIEPINHRLSLPTSVERRVLIAIYHRPTQLLKTKIVWLIAPSSP